MRKTNRNILLVAGLASALYGCQSNPEASPHKAHATPVYAPVESAAVPATILTGKDLVVATAKKQIMPYLSRVNLVPTPDVNPRFVGPTESVVSPATDTTCAVQIDFDYNSQTGLPLVVFEFAAPSQVFRGSEQAYTHAIIAGPHNESSLLNGSDLVPGELLQNLGKVASLINTFCPPSSKP